MTALTRMSFLLYVIIFQLFHSPAVSTLGHIPVENSIKVLLLYRHTHIHTQTCSVCDDIMKNLNVKNQYLAAKTVKQIEFFGVLLWNIGLFYHFFCSKTLINLSVIFPNNLLIVWSMKHNRIWCLYIKKAEILSFLSRQAKRSKFSHWRIFILIWKITLTIN